MRSVVDLPAPLTPRRPSTSPFAMARFRSRTTTRPARARVAFSSARTGAAVMGRIVSGRLAGRQGVPEYPDGPSDLTNQKLRLSQTLTKCHGTPTPRGRIVSLRLLPFPFGSFSPCPTFLPSLRADSLKPPGGTWIAYTLVATQLTIFSVTLYLHRSQTHRGVDFHPDRRPLLPFLGVDHDRHGHEGMGRDPSQASREGRDRRGIRIRRRSTASARCSGKASSSIARRRTTATTWKSTAAARRKTGSSAISTARTRISARR